MASNVSRAGGNPLHLRKLQSTQQRPSVLLCRCEASFENLYDNNRRHRDRQLDSQENEKHRRLGPYDYSDSYIDRNGFYIVEGVRVLPSRNVKCRGRKGMNNRVKNDIDTTADQKQSDESEITARSKPAKTNTKFMESHQRQSRKPVSSGMRETNENEIAQVIPKRSGKGTHRRAISGKTFKVTETEKNNGKRYRSRNGKGNKNGKGAANHNGKASGKGKQVTGKAGGKSSGKGKGTRSCRDRPFSLNCLPRIAPCDSGDDDDDTAPTAFPTALIENTPTTAPNSLIIETPSLFPDNDMPTSAPMLLIQPTTAATNNPSATPVIILPPVTTDVPSFRSSTRPSFFPSNAPSLAACQECADSNSCFSTSCEAITNATVVAVTNKTVSCIYTPIITCATGLSCDPSNGSCRNQSDLRPCVAVIDESSLGYSYIDKRWNDFRNAYPDRPFCLLQPINSGFVDPLTNNDLYLPPTFLNDTKAAHFNITREDGFEVIPNPPLADWFDICDIDVYAATGVEFVGLFVDTSGSLTAAAVAQMLGNFTSRLNQTGLAYKSLFNTYEDWILPFLTDLSTL